MHCRCAWYLSVISTAPTIAQVTMETETENETETETDTETEKWGKGGVRKQ